MRRLIASAIVVIVFMAGTISPRADGDNTNNRRAQERAGRHWAIVDALEYCQKLHELIAEDQRKNKTESRFRFTSNRNRRDTWKFGFGETRLASWDEKSR